MGRSYAQTIVGMGTEDPNPNAVLELVAKNQNQGLLVPRLSTNDITLLAEKLSQKDNGLLVFVEDQGKFYYWWNNDWHILEPVDALPDQGDDEQNFPGKGTIIDNNHIRDVCDLDSTNELQSLSSVLRLGDDAEGQRIRNVADPIDEQDVATRNFVTNQLKSLPSPTLIYDDATSTLSINGSNTVSLAESLTKTDSQTLSLSGKVLTISNGNSVDLAPIISTNTDEQALSFTGTTLSIENGNSVNLAGINTDAQTLGLSGSTLSISGGNDVDLSSLDNDRQALTLTGNSLGISNGNTVDLGTVVGSSTLPEGHVWVGNNNNQPIALDAHSDARILVGNGTTVASVTITGDLVLQADGTLTLKNTAVTTNKIADAAVTTPKIADDAITRDKINANVAGIGLNQAIDGSLEVANTGSGKLLIGQGSSVASQSISGDLSLSNTGDTKVTGLQGRAISATGPTENQVLTWNGSTWTPAGSATQQWYDGTATPDATNPSGTSDGDYYYDTDDNKVYRKVSGSWTELGGFNTVPPAAINMAGKADSYRTPVLYLGDEKPIIGDDIGDIGDFYYCRNEQRLYYKARNVGSGNIEWRTL